MVNDSHLGEDVLNMYLDGELTAEEREQAKAHLTACKACRAEIAALQSVFVALDELASAPAPDLETAVVARLRSRRKLIDPRSPWLAPLLQGAIALALLALSWTWLARTLLAAVDYPWLERMAEISARATAWASAHWAMFRAWPGAASAGVQKWLARLSAFDDPEVALPQLVLALVALAALWLVGNAALVHRASLNGQAQQRLGGG